MAEAADDPGAAAAAADLAEWLVAVGMPFREAHHVVAGLVRAAAAAGSGGTLADLVAAHPDLGPAAVGLLEPGAAVARRTTAGGAGPGPVAEQLRRFRARVAEDRERIAW